MYQLFSNTTSLTTLKHELFRRFIPGKKMTIIGEINETYESRIFVVVMYIEHTKKTARIDP